MTFADTQELPWDEYVSAPSSQAILDSCRMTCGPALKKQRNIIERLLGELRPERAVFLGAGYLNDIPVERLFEQGLAQVDNQTQESEYAGSNVSVSSPYTDPIRGIQSGRRL